MIEERSRHRPRVQLLGSAIAVHVDPGSLGVVCETRDELGRDSKDS